MLRVIGHINGTVAHILFDSGRSNNFLNERLVQEMQLLIGASDHIYIKFTWQMETSSTSPTLCVNNLCR